MGQHRHARFFQHARHQALAAARHDQVNQARSAQHGADKGAVCTRRNLHRRFRQTCQLQPLRHAGMDGGGAAQAFRPTTQDYRIAGFKAKRGGIGGDIGPAFENHADHAKRLCHALQAKPIGALPFRQHAANGVRQRGYFFKPFRHGLNARGVQQQPVTKSRCQPRCGGDVFSIGGDNTRLMVAQGCRCQKQRLILHRAWRASQRNSRRTGGARGLFQGLGGIGGHGVHGQKILSGQS